MIALARAAVGIALWAAHGATLGATGPYPPAAGQPGSTAIAYTDPALRWWATGWHDYAPGPGVDDDPVNGWNLPQRALGAVSDDMFDIVSLGHGGRITLEFAVRIVDGPGWDFAVFENGFSPQFLELAFVEVSSDGVHFARFPSHSLTPGPVGAFGAVMDPSLIDGLAGKYSNGYGTPFDLADLPPTPAVDTTAIRFVRLVDVIGNGSSVDSRGNPVYAPYPTVISGGFDLNGIGVMNGQALPLAANSRLELMTDGNSWGLIVELAAEDVARTHVEMSNDGRQWLPLGAQLPVAEEAVARGDGTVWRTFYRLPPTTGPRLFRLRAAPPTHATP
jgi:hypothetical protein